MKLVYHASPIQGLSVLEPKQGTFPGKWVYATRDKEIAALFLGRFLGDLSCQIGRDEETGLPFLCERFENAMDMRYNVPGSIYHLPETDFIEASDGWREEVVCPDAVIPIKEEKIGNARDYLFELAKKGKLLIARYPKKICGIPEDNSDLVKKAIRWAKEGKTDVLEAIRKYHPDLFNKVLEGLK